MKVSIVTVSYNSGKTIVDTLHSVAEQTYSNIEHVIVDGGSIDRTIDIINGWTKHNLNVTVEGDAGIYDAMNKGIRISTGDVVGILNSDDFYSNTYVIADIVKEFEVNKVDCVFADLVYVDSADINVVTRMWKSSPYFIGAFAKGWHPSHPTFFVRRKIYEKYGLFDLSFEISADFELMLRFLEKYQITSSYLPKVIVNMREGGESGRNLKNILIGNMNVLRAFRKNGIIVNPLFYLLNRLVPKIINRIRCIF